MSIFNDEDGIGLGDIEVYRAVPAEAPRGAIILIHEIWGLVDHIRSIADRLAAQGYLVIAPDLLSAVGITPEVGLQLAGLMREPDEEKRVANQAVLRERLAPIRSPEFATSAVERLRRVVDHLEGQDGIDGRIAVLGFCFGGSYSFALAASDDRVRAAVPFYGTAPEPEAIPAISCPVLALYGAIDPPLIEALPSVRERMREAGVDFTDHVYPGARHAFFNDTNPVAYDADAADDAWRRALDFLETSLR